MKIIFKSLVIVAILIISPITIRALTNNTRASTYNQFEGRQQYSRTENGVTTKIAVEKKDGAWIIHVFSTKKTVFSTKKNKWVQCEVKSADADKETWEFKAGNNKNFILRTHGSGDCTITDSNGVAITYKRENLDNLRKN